MSLFTSQDIQQKTPLPGGVGGGSLESMTATAITTKRKTRQVIHDSKAQLESCIKQLEPNKVIKYWTNGAWSMHELVEYLLLQTGPAVITFCTWTIGEEAARKLFELKQAGLIIELHALFDYRVKERAPEAHQLLQGICDTICLGRSHAKVTVIKNKLWGVSISGSANYSRNKRLESGTISTYRPDADFDWSFLQNQLRNEWI